MFNLYSHDQLLLNGTQYGVFRKLQFNSISIILTCIFFIVSIFLSLSLYEVVFRPPCLSRFLVIAFWLPIMAWSLFFAWLCMCRNVLDLLVLKLACLTIGVKFESLLNIWTFNKYAEWWMPINTLVEGKIHRPRDPNPNNYWTFH